MAEENFKAKTKQKNNYQSADIFAEKDVTDTEHCETCKMV